MNHFLNKLQVLRGAFLGAALLTTCMAEEVLAQAKEIPLGSPLPLMNQSFATTDGGQAQLSSIKGSKGTVIVFWSDDCPWVTKLEGRLQNLIRSYSSRGIGFALVTTGGKGAGGLGSAKSIVDDGSALSKAFGATRAPDIFVFDANNTLVYVGSVDDSPGDPQNVKKTYLKDALDAVVSGSPVAVPQTKAFGCMLK